MATEVLRPQNCLVDPMRDSPAVFQRRKNGYFSNPNAKSSRRPPVGPEQRRRFGSDELRTARIAAGHEIFMEKVTILRRGESLDSKIKGERSPQKNEREMTPQKPPPEIADDVYAGSATFVGSPAPSSLPLPSFSRKVKNPVVLVDDLATRDLRRLLRLEL